MTEFQYIPEGQEPIVFPDASTISGEVEGKTLLEFLWEMDDRDYSETQQLFAWLKRSGATDEMKRRVLRLGDELPAFFDSWLSGLSHPTSLSPES